LDSSLLPELSSGSGEGDKKREADFSASLFL